MNPANPPNGANGHHAPPAGFGVDDAVFTLFRHKWLILAFVAMGIVGAIAVRLKSPPLYFSNAKLMIWYVLETKNVNPPDAGGQLKATDPFGQNIINSEIQILTSQDLATKVADVVGPKVILARQGGGDDRLAAAGVILSGLSVEVPLRTTILSVTFKHQDRDVVEPVLHAIIDAYMHKHLEVHQGIGVLNDYYKQQRDELLTKLSRTEEDLKRLKTQSGVLFLDDTKRSYQTHLNRVQEELLDAERELAERKAVLGHLSSGMTRGEGTNATETVVPPDKLKDYSYATTTLENLKTKERELLLQFTEAYPIVQAVRSQINKLNETKAALEKEFPSLSSLGIGAGKSGTNVTGIDVAVELAETKRLSARVVVLGNILSNIQSQTSRVMDIEPKLTQLQRQRDEEEKDYQFYLKSLEQAQLGESLASGKVVNMSVIQHPTPPGVDMKKLMKLVGIVFGGCVSMGLGLAFLIDMVLDRSIRRTPDVERLLRLPVFLTVPDTTWSNQFRLPKWLRRGARTAEPASAASGNGEGRGTMAVARWSPEHHLQDYTEGLRERIISYFEVHNLNHKKPKLVGVTGCHSGAGVSTLASGLAAALSKTGDGNVLLVDMNVAQGVAHSFYKGKPGCGISEALEPENRAEAQVQENLYLATLNHGADDKLVKVLPTRFNQLVPRLKASDYDYIIFDMPPVTQRSATPRLTSYMDLALLVLESEKTSQHSAIRASAMMREARANVAAVLNKQRSHVPAVLSQED